MTSVKVSVDSKLRLVEYLSGRVREGLAGRDGADIDGAPGRSIFAGVLQSPHRPGDSQRRQKGNTESPPAGTSLGVTFRVKPASSEAAIEITPACAIYHPVFPSFEQALRANPGLRSTRQGDSVSADTEAAAPDQAAADGAPLTVSPLLLGGEVPDDRVDLPDEEGDEEAEPPEAPTDRVFLPVCWRRCDVPFEASSFTIAPTTATPEIGRRLLADGFATASASASRADASWRHLGEPKERQRFLGAPHLLANEETYQLALSSPLAPVSLPDWRGEIRVSCREEAQGLLRVTVFLCNITPYPEAEDTDQGLVETALFDSRLSIRLLGCQLAPFQFLLAPKDYRSDPTFAVKGINCTAHLSDTAPSTIVTESLPTFAQPLYRTRDNLEVDFTDLTGDGALGALQHIHTSMLQYLDQWQSFLHGPTAAALSNDERRECEKDREQFRAEVERFRLGIQCLEYDATLRDAFGLMNQAFSALADRSGGRIRAWRLFQIGFICSQMPALAIRQQQPEGPPEHLDALRAAHQDVGVLWFPTGGGKTEAYLGLIATCLLFDRLRGKERGLSAWMRFPLRMLSLQQMERLARVVAVLNELRDHTPRLSQGDPFAIGYYVGDTNTPNRVSAEQMKEYEASPTKRDRLRLLRRCPHCSAHLEVKTLRTSWRLAHVCPNPNCFTNRSTSLGKLRGTVPVFIVDNEAYRYLPAVLVGTVDKLAIIARSRHFFQFLRGAPQECPVHGYTAFNECMEAPSFSAGCQTKKRELAKVTPFFDPGPSLLIQDELHLLSAELGVFNGHYEGLLRHITDGVYLRPKVLAATATIQAYGTQAFHLYLSDARRFPEPGWALGESFYATSSPREDRRHFLGVLSHGRAVEDVVLKILGIYQREIRLLQTNPTLTRSVIGTPQATDSELSDLLRLYDLSVAYVNRKATGGSLVDKLSRAEAFLTTPGDRIHSQFLTGDQSIDEVGAALDRIEREGEDTGLDRLDLLIATSLISHGVDLERINMMVVCGMPRTTPSTFRRAAAAPVITRA
jgi:hypothetical protein